jgi:NTP pyrophosphatase (non-canonical NTP hydrolase)
MATIDITLTIFLLVVVIGCIILDELVIKKKDVNQTKEIKLDANGIFGDRLEVMWNQQHEFMVLLQKHRGFPVFPTDITSKKGQQFLKDIRNHLMEELFEAGQHLRNSKSHRATNIPDIDREAYKEELVDALHLYFELVIASGVSLDELHEAYMKKGDVNHQRILNNY